MIRIAILGGGISGLAAAYELELARKKNPELDWHLYEATDRLGGIVETTQRLTPNGTYTLEGGPDGWVTDKPWARDLVLELGLERDLIPSNDATRKTYIAVDNQLLAMPGRMRMMVPEDLATLDTSPLFTPAAKAAYAAELANAAQLKAGAEQRRAAGHPDESVASFVLRHFGQEVLDKIGAPLLSGVFGGDVQTLSVNAVMAPFVKMELEHGSLIAALQAKARQHGSKPLPALFTSLRNGMGSLTAALIARLPAERLHLNQPAVSLKREGKLWCLRTAKHRTEGAQQTAITGKSKKHFRHVFLATSLDAARTLLIPIDRDAAALLPTDASSAVLAAFAWPANSPQPQNIPSGFGFLVSHSFQKSVLSTEAQRSGETCSSPTPDRSPTPPLLAVTFVDQKFQDRAPQHARVLRAFFGTGSAEHFADTPDADVAVAALTQLQTILGTFPPPDPTLTTVRRWPRSLPQYAVGHLDRMAQLDTRIANLPGLHLLGNSYRGVGLPDLIFAARSTVREVVHLTTKSPSNP
jgi:oxygen-dependent protoporphyrinogen oxidase